MENISDKFDEIYQKHVKISEFKEKYTDKMVKIKIIAKLIQKKEKNYDKFKDFHEKLYRLNCRQKSLSKLIESEIINILYQNATFPWRVCLIKWKKYVENPVKIVNFHGKLY